MLHDTGPGVSLCTSILGMLSKATASNIGAHLNIGG